MNYSELQTEIADYLNKDNLTSYIPGFITKCENKLNRKLRLREQRQLSTATYSSGSRFVALPDDFIEIIELQIKKNGEADTKYEPVEYTAPERLYLRYESEGTPSHYTIRDQIEFNCEASQDHTLKIHFLKKWDIATDTTNWLLTNYEDAYLYGSMLEAEAFMKNDPRLPIWKSIFSEVMKELNEMDERNTDDAVLTTDFVSREYFNIIKGGYRGR